jgi:SAM-dependent methyltransferase
MTAERTDLAAGSPERFGYEWHNYAELRPEYEAQFRGWTVHLSPEDWRGLEFLDVGCGMGRNSYWPLRYGAAAGTAIDVDARSLAAARRTLANFPAATVRALSAYDIDMRDRYDIAFSIGVIHHLEFPERAVRAMAEAVKPGGRVLIWVYGRENNEWIVTLLDPLRKALFQLLRRLSFRHLRSIVFDQMLPRIAHYWPREAAIALLRQAGLEDVRAAWVNEMSWSVIGRRPATGGS